MKKSNNKINLNNESGFIIADFLFSFVLVISCGIVIFALTFSLATIEISQYIVWTTARNYSAGNTNEAAAKTQASLKFKNMADQFPLLTANGSTWFVLNGLAIGDLASPGIDNDLRTKLAADRDNKDQVGEFRQPWTGAKADLELKLLSGMKIPFLGPMATDKTAFTFPVRAFIIRHPSQSECYDFYSASKRFSQGIQKLEPQMSSIGSSSSYIAMEDNGC